jgi:hypothetical protein
MNNLGKLIPLADHVIFLEKSGTVTNQAPPSQVDSISLYSDSEQELVLVENCNHVTGTDLPRKEDGGDIENASQKGDLSTFTYYFRAIGRQALLLFVLLLVNVTFLENFSV